METMNHIAMVVGYLSMAAIVAMFVRYPVRYVSLTLFYMVAYARAGFWRSLPSIPAMCWRDNGFTHGLVEVSTLNMTWCGAFHWKFGRRD